MKPIFKSFRQYMKYIISHNNYYKIIFNVDDRIHYVYRVTDIRSNTHYYGSRSSVNVPSEDLGKTYFSSSKYLKPKFQNKPDDFKYKIIKIFDNPGDCIILESYLHQYFQVSSNTNFINRSIQTPFGFTITGNKIISNKISKSLRTINPDTGNSIATDSALKSAKTMTQTINPDTGNSIATDSALKSAKTMSIKHSNGYTIRQIATAKTIITKKKIDPITGLSINSKVGLSRSGKNCHMFKGYYVYNNLNFDTSHNLSNHLNGLIKSTTIRKLVKNLDHKITNVGYKRSKFFITLGPESEIVGKSYKDLGFNFII